MPQYQIWIEDDSYAKQAIITRYKKLSYRQELNGIGHATLEMHPDDPKIADLQLMRRLKIIRDGEIVFGGILLREEWKIPETAPADETWVVHALDHAVYADWRLVVPPAGQAYDERTGAADDLAKAYVYYHAGAGADVARQFSDLSVQANASAAPSITERGRYITLLTLLQKLADKGGFDWRFVPLASGCEFRTAYPHWGLDRTKGNGVNDECVFSLDRRNFSELDYIKDLLDHWNYVYVGGQGEGADRTIVERSNSGYISRYKRREGFADARHLSLPSSLQAYGDAELEARKPVEVMEVQPAPGTWKAASGTTWDLGDLVSVYVRIWGRTLTMDAKVVALTVEVTPEELEVVRPELEKV